MQTYTVWTNRMTIAYKTRDAFHPQHRVSPGCVDEYTEETAYWFEPEAIASGLTEKQARDFCDALECVARLTPVRNEEIRAAAHQLALSRKESVVLHSFWATLDGVEREDAAGAPALGMELAAYG